MTTIVGGSGGGINIFGTDTLQAIAASTLSNNSSTQFTLSNSDYSLTGHGSGIGYSHSHPSSGTITSVSFNYSIYSSTWSGFNLSVSTVWNAISSGDINTFNNLFFGGNDTFTSGAVGWSDRFAGYGGNDVFNFTGNFNGGTFVDGGTGNDTVNLNGDYSNGLYLFSSNLAGVENINLGAGHNYWLSLDTSVASGGSLKIDASALGASNSLTFGSYGDAIFTVIGGAGADNIRGGTSNDTLSAGAGDDTMAGGGGNDTFNGGDGNDTMTGDAGNDAFNGGAGSDTIDLSNATGGVNVDLSLGTATGFGNDTLNSIENIIGSSHNDTLKGNASDNTFEGDGGYDVIDGGAGNDTVVYKMGNEYPVTVDLNITGPQVIDYFGDTQTLTSIENITVLGGATLTGNASDNVFNGGTGSTVSLIHATSGATINTMGANPVVTVSGLGKDTYIGITGFIGTNFNDTLITDSRNYTGFDGGAGYDTVDFSKSVAPAFIETYDTRLQNVENIIGTNYNDQIAAGGKIDGGAGNDILSGFPGGTLLGGTGDDSLNFFDSFDGTTHADGGSGNDTVTLEFISNTPLIFGPTTMVNVENLSLVSGYGFDITTSDATVAAGATLTVTYDTTSYQSTFYGLRFDGSAETNGNFNITIGNVGDDTLIGGAGNDTLDSGDGNDTIDISTGGADTVRAGAGNDKILVGGALAAGATIDGGSGNDTVVLNGNYSAGFTIAAPTLANIEALKLMGGHNYNLGMAAGYLAAGQTFSIDASGLQSGDSFSFDGSHQSSGSFVFGVTNGTLVLTGGGGIDTIDFSTAGSGANINLSLSTAQATGLGTATLNSIENANGSDYNDTLVAKSSKTHLAGNGGDDLLDFGGLLTNTSVADGGSGVDTLRLNGNYSAGLNFGPNTLVSIEALQLGAGHNYVLTINDDNMPQDQGFYVDGSALGAANSLSLDGSNITSRNLFITGGGGNDVLKGGSGFDTLNSGNGGVDTLSGGAGYDTLMFGGSLTAADVADGGADLDTLELNGNYSAKLTFSPTTMVNIETLKLDGGHNYSLALDDANVASGQTLNVDATALGASDTLTFDGSHETNGAFYIPSNAGLNILTGGAGNDSFSIGSNFTAADVINGGAGNDTVVLGNNSPKDVIFAATTMVNVETLMLVNNYQNGFHLVMNDANVPVGQTLTVDATRLSFDLTFDGSQELDGNFIVTGGYGSNLFMGGAGNDTLNGGLGFDTVSYANATGGVAVNLNISSGQAVGGGQGSDTLIAIENLTGSNYDDTLRGNGGYNVVSGLAGNDTLDLSDGGNDTALGGDGNDTIKLGATFTAADKIDGGTGNDTVILVGDYSAGVTFAATTMVGVEKISLATGHNYSLTLNDANVAAGQTLTVDGHALGATDTMTFDGSHETDGNFILSGGAGNDVLKASAGDDALSGGAGNDTLNGGGGNDTADYSGATGGVNVDLTNSGAQAVGGGQGTDTLVSIENVTGSKFNDTLLGNSANNVLTGGAGNDTFTFAATFGAADIVDGGPDTDTLSLAGATSVAFGAATMVNVEKISVAAGFNYSLTLNDANVAAGQTLTVSGSVLGAANSLHFDGSAETDGKFILTGGAGNDVLTGGAGNDTITAGLGKDIVSGGDGSDVFNFGAALTAGDKIDGGAGADLVSLAGDYSVGVAFAAATMVNVETLRLSAGFNYKLATADANVAAGQQLKIDASALGAGNSLSFNGAAETDGHFSIIGGAGNDIVTGGAGADMFTLSSGGNDLANGGDGDDTFIFASSFTAGDSVRGGNGNDTLSLSGDYSTPVTFGAATMNGIEQIKLAAGHSYSLTLDNSNIAAGQTLTVTATGLAAADRLVFDGSHETHGILVLNAGAGNDVLTGGAGNDTISGGGGDDAIAGGLGADAITLGSGADRAVYTSAAQSTGANYDTVSGFNASATDKFDFAFTVAAVDTAVKHGALSTASFDSDLAAAVGAGQLGVHHAMLYTPDSGTLAVQTFLVVDANGVAGYQAGADFAIHLDHLSGAIDVTDFI